MTEEQKDILGAGVVVAAGFGGLGLILGMLIFGPLTALFTGVGGAMLGLSVGLIVGSYFAARSEEGEASDGR